MKTMLVPLDGSSLSETVLPVAMAIAGGAGYQVALLSVWEALPEELEAIGEEHVRELRDHGLKYFRTYLGNIGEVLRQKGIETITEVRAGHPAAEILGAAVELEADMIAMATHARQGVSYGRRGSVADKVLRGSTIPILVLGPRSLESWPPSEVRIRSLLVPLDGSSESESALPLAVELARQLSAKVSLLRVAPQLLGRYEVGLPESLPPEVDKRRERAVSRYLKGVQGRFPEVISDVHVERGLPRQVIPSFIERHGYDLVVMASRSRYGWGRWSLGSVADAVIEGPAPVILVPPFQR